MNSRYGLSDESALDVCPESHLRLIPVRLTAQTLTVFLGIVLAKRYTNPSSEIITLLAGLDEVDPVFLNFANAIENVIRSGESGTFLVQSSKSIGAESVAVDVRQKAIEVAISLTAGAYQTSLVSYFTHRDLFPCLMKVWRSTSLNLTVGGIFHIFHLSF